MQYLALWRMQLASRRLIDGEQVARCGGFQWVGYESEAAFSRALRDSSAPRPPRGETKQR